MPSAAPTNSARLALALAALGQLTRLAGAESYNARHDLAAAPASAVSQELHLGAQVALSLLTALVALVAFATLADYRARRQEAAAAGRFLFGARRDYRSLSMSSSCSSNLFANSATSLSGSCGGSSGARRERGELLKQRRRRLVELAGQLLRAFSLRQSARQIFGGVAQPAEAAAAAATPSEEKQQAHGEQQRESVDSLHGLRFMSMIWVIVIHSYNFALRWTLFADTITLDGLYKSAASQLIANGSFACDSFFFASGFLLPYTIFQAPTGGSLKQHQRRRHEQQQQQRGECEQQRQEQQQQQHQQQRQQEQDSKHQRRLRQLINENNNNNNNNNNHNHETRAAPPAPSTSCKCGLFQVSGTLLAGPQQRGCACCACPTRACLYSEQDQNTNEPPPVRLGGESCGTAASGGGARNPNHEHDDDDDDERAHGFTFKRILANILHRYIRMMPLMMAIIGLCATLLRYLGDGPVWEESTVMYDGWCRRNWWINALFLHNFLDREHMCLSHSWYSAVDLQLFLVSQLLLFVLAKSRKLGLLLLIALICCSQLITMALTIAHHLPAVPLVSSVNEQTMNLYYGEIYIKPYCRASPYFIGILLAYLMRTTKLGQLKLQRWQLLTGWSLSFGAFVAIIMAMQPAMNGLALSELESALYSALSRPLWALATGWVIFACMTNQAGIIASILGARCLVPLSRLTYPAFLVHPIIMALFYGSRQASFHFSHYLMFYLIVGNIVITYASAFVLAALFELPLISIERTLRRRAFATAG